MQEPAYILKNGQSIPYIPVEVKTARDAYAASLHILFKHVADFHICVVRVFSVKYGIPEDDILKTIQESDEFKNMKVDPVLDMGVDSLGYLEKEEVPVPKEEVPVPKEEVPVPKVPVKRAKSIKMTKTNTVVIIAEKSMELIESESRPDPVLEPETSTIKIKTIRKKMVVPKPATTAPATTTATTAPATTTATTAPATTTSTTAPATTTATTAPTTATTTATTAPATTAMQTLATRPEDNAPRKIIKKKTTIIDAIH